MTIDVLQKDMITAWKSGDKERKEVLSSLVGAVKKVGIDNKCHDNIPEDMVNTAILKELKTVQEQIATCPESRQDLLEKYKFAYAVISEYAPKMLERDEIKAIILEKFADVIATKNKGMIMKNVMPELKGKADGKLINEIVAELIKG